MRNTPLFTLVVLHVDRGKDSATLCALAKSPPTTSGFPSCCMRAGRMRAGRLHSSKWFCGLLVFSAWQRAAGSEAAL